MKKPVVLQEEISDCGAACLLSIIRYYKGDANLETLRMESNTTNRGVSAYDLIKCARTNGFNAKGYKDTNLSNYNTPCIIHLKINQSLTHFVVLYEIGENKYTIMDPAKGLVSIKKETLNSMLTGYLIALDPLNSLPKRKNDNIIKKEVIKEFKLQKAHMLKILLFDLIFIFLSIIFSFYIKIYNYPSFIILLTILFSLISVLIEILPYFIYKTIYNLKNKIDLNLTNYFFNHILHLPLKYLHLKDPGEIVKRSNEVSVINEIVLNTLISVVIDSLIVVGTLVIIMIYSKVTLLMLLLSIVLLSVISLFTVKRLRTKSTSAIDAGTDYNNALIDSIYGLTSIKHSRSEAYLEEKLKTKLKSKQREEKNYNYYLKRYDAFKSSIFSLIRIIVNMYLISRIYKNDFSFENLIILDTLVEITINSSTNTISSLMELIFVKNLLFKANDFYNISTTCDKKKKKFLSGDIIFKNINYTYNTDHPLIKNFTTTIKRGEKVIIRGESGTGKSTICKMLYQEINNYEGTISINGRNILEIDQSNYLKNIIYSSQTERIFSATIKENIVLGKDIESSKLDKVIEICELNRILNKRVFGLDSILFSGGEDLSGGERQLIILARALVSDFEILILDETLSEVNDEVEDKILNNIFTYFKDKTIIYVTHKNNKNYFNRTINV